MADPIVIRVTRPYPNEDEFLAAEGWCIDDKGMVLVDQPELPKDTIVRFEVVLDDGSKPIRAEGKVSRMVAPTQGRPGGLKVRFRRFDAATKRFIERAVEQRKKERRSRRPPPPAELAPLVLDADPALGEAAPESLAAPTSVAAPTSAAAQVSERAPEPAPAPAKVRTAELATEGSGVHQRVVSAVAAPPNRDELLARLRERGARLGKR